MKRDRRLNARVLARLNHGPKLLARGPRSAEHQIAGAASGSKALEEPLPLGRQDDVAALPALAHPDGNRASIGVEVADDEPRKLPVTATCVQRGFHKEPKVSLSSVQKPPRLFNGEIARSR